LKKSHLPSLYGSEHQLKLKTGKKVFAGLFLQYEEQSLHYEE